MPRPVISDLMGRGAGTGNQTADGLYHQTTQCHASNLHRMLDGRPMHIVALGDYQIQTYQKR